MTDFPAAVPLLPQLPKQSQADILALFDRLLPDHYLIPLKNPGPGYEYLQAIAAMIARVSTAISRTASGAFIGSGTGGSYATVQVRLTRPSAIFAEVTLAGRDQAPQGTLVGTEDSYYYQLMETVTFGLGDVGPKLVTAQAVARGWTWNRPGPFTTADGEFVPGPINRLIRPVFPSTPSPPNFDPTIVVEQVTAAEGGSSPMLDAVGGDRGIVREFSGITQASLSRIGSNPISILPGSVFSTVDGFHYQTTEIVTFADDEVGPKYVAVSPLFLNVRANDRPLISIVNIVWGSSEQDPTLVVGSFTPRAESDTAYRARIAALPDTVTPLALQRNLTRVLGNILSQADKTYGYREVWDLRYQTAYDFTPNQTLYTANLNVPVPAGFNGNVFVYDYAPPDALSNRYLAANPERGVVVVKLPPLADPLEQGQIYPQAASLIEQVKPAGATVLYVLAD